MDHLPNPLVRIYMMFSLRSDSKVYTHINLAPCSCVHRKMQDGSTASPISSKSLPRRTMSLKADSVLTRYSFQSQRRHQGVWGRRRFNQTVVVMFACVWRLSLSPERPRRHPEVALRTLLPVPSDSGYDQRPKDLWGGGAICNISHVFLCCALNHIRIWLVKSRRMRLAEHVAYMG